MSVWFKILGGVAGMALGGPFGAVVGAALGHAAESGGFGKGAALPGGGAGGAFGGAPGGFAAFGQARMAALLGRRDQVFAMCVVVLSAKLAKCDGPVNRAEIDAFKRHFNSPPEAARAIGRLFDEARDSSEGYQRHATQLGESFADAHGVLEDVLTALFAIARADRPMNAAEAVFLRGTWTGFGLDQAAWDRASGARPRAPWSSGGTEDDPYEVLGVTRRATDEELHVTWKKLMRENHPDSLASRGVPADFIARASEKVARINAAWDSIKRERRL